MENDRASTLSLLAPVLPACGRRQGQGLRAFRGEKPLQHQGVGTPAHPAASKPRRARKSEASFTLLTVPENTFFFFFRKNTGYHYKQGISFQIKKKKTVCACILPPSSAGEAGEKKRRRSRPLAWPRGSTAGSRCGSCACCGTCIGVLCIGVWAPSQRLGDRPGSACSQPTPDSRGPSVLLHSPRTLYKHRTICVAIVCIKKSQSHFVSVGNICTYHCPSFDSEHLFSRLPFEFQLQGSANE